ncbi:MAG: hypothetical protein ACI4MI_01090, partial [Christensenellales bacterium]
MDRNVVVLDIGSGKLTIAVGYKTASGVFVIKNFADMRYGGYYDARFVEPDNLLDDVREVLTKSGTDGRYDTIYVGVPTDFLRVENNSLYSVFNKEKTITSSMIDDMHKEGNIFNRDSQYVPINSSANDYILDNDYHTLSPIGKRATRLRANLSYTYCSRYFVDIIDSVLGVCGFSKINYVGSIQAIANGLIDESRRIDGAVLVDVGFVNASIGYIKGEGLTYLTSIGVGGGNIADDLAYAMKVDFDDAYDFFGKLNLNQELNENAVYTIRSGGETLAFGAVEVNEIVLGRLRSFGDWIVNQLKIMDKPLKDDCPIYLTGGSLTSIRGAVGFLERHVGRSFEVLTADLPQYNQAKYTSTIAMLDVASEIYNSQSIWKKIFG